ncbi:tetratricopeptide repeat protein [Halocynthiibacter styelae]|uniref:Tetratricopeptide repeat protein n=1 Tax=Halocynthiibacter styelae TaxID=2761955 RepID=A0A8J7LUB5_9RHOB|nr:tetratricopeptide repeat protein [Paenihalocynthiibacter styelae]MBI1492607.1 tetratricopeptide repeat protein [Paenihalocynthiibacter styelae]
MTRFIPLVLLISALAACGQAGLTTKSGSPYAPRGNFDPADSVDGLIVGHRLMAAGEYDLALEAYYRAAGQYGLTADTLSGIGSAQLMLGRLGQAETTLRQAVKEGSDFPEAWNNLGVVLMERNQTAEAVQVFRQAYALDSGESDSIRDNLRGAIAKNEDLSYDGQSETRFDLIGRGNGSYLLLTPS